MERQKSGYTFISPGQANRSKLILRGQTGTILDKGIYLSAIILSRCRVFDLKATLYSLTNVPPERQKILGLVKGKLPSEEGTM